MKKCTAHTRARSCVQLVIHQLFFYALCFITLVFPLLGKTQDRPWTKEEQSWRLQAEGFLNTGEILRALPLYDTLLTLHPEENDLKYNAAQCFLTQNSKRKQALKWLEELKTAEYPKTELFFFLGKAHHYLYNFDEAVAAFQQYQKQPGLSPERRKEVEQYLSYCRFGKKAIDEIVVVTIELLEPPSSLEGSEYVPLITPDESILIFTYRGPESRGGRMNTKGDLDDRYGTYYEDVFYANRQDTTWTEAKSIGNSLNTFGHDAAIGMSSDGQQLLVYKSDRQTNEDIFVSRLQGTKWSQPEALEGDVNTDEWEGSASLTSDGCLIYFASDRPGGYGGRDLYVGELMDDGSWKYVRNLGPRINTALNEDSPFIHPDNNTLYFSSEGHNSMGGYDIFFSYLSDTGWVHPENIGYPINTTDDDRFFVMSADGRRGYFSSARADQGNQHDIFVATFEEAFRPTRLVELFGTLRIDQRPLEGELHIRDLTSGNDHAVHRSNAANGSYSVFLEPGHEYQIQVKVPGQPPKVERLVVDEINGFAQVEADFEWATGNVNLPPEDEPSTTTLQERFNTGIVAEKVRIVAEKEAREEVRKPNPDDIGLALELVLTPEDKATLSEEVLQALQGAESRTDEQGNFRYRFTGLQSKEDLEALEKQLKDKGLEAAEYVTVLEISPQALAAAREEENRRQDGTDPLLGKKLEIIIPPGERYEVGRRRLSKMPNLEKFESDSGAIRFQLGTIEDSRELAATRQMLDGLGLADVPMTPVPGQETVSDPATETAKTAGHPLLNSALALQLSSSQVKSAGAENLEKLAGSPLEQKENGQYQLRLGPYTTVNELALVQSELMDLGLGNVALALVEDVEATETALAEATANGREKPAELGKVSGGSAEIVSSDAEINDNLPAAATTTTITTTTATGNQAKGGEDLVLEIIYHDFDRSTIEGVEKEKLDQLIVAMRSRPGIRVRLNSHTDSRGTESYNQRLSKRRVETTEAYLVAAGIDAERIEKRWHGESQLINHCDNNSDCSSTEHAKNRRTEIEVIAY